MELTEIDARFYADVVKYWPPSKQLKPRVVGLRNRPAGILTHISADILWQIACCPILADFLHKFPDVTAQLDLSDEYVDLLRLGSM